MGNAAAPGAKRTLTPGMNSLEISEVNPDLNIEVTVRYWLLPNMPFAALVRRVEITNLGDQAFRGSLLDGLPRVQPFGVSDWLLKNMSTTIGAWMRVEHTDNGLPLFKVISSIEDRPEVTEIRGGNFACGCQAGDGAGAPLAMIYDAQEVFGPDFALAQPIVPEGGGWATVAAKSKAPVGRGAAAFFTT